MVSIWHGLFHLLIHGVFVGVTTHLLTIDPNFQRDIQVQVGVVFVCLEVLFVFNPPKKCEFLGRSYSWQTLLVRLRGGF